MHIPQIFITPFAIALIIIGILKLNNKFNEKELRRSNSLRGVKTEMNKGALRAQIIVGWFMLLLGITMLIFVFVVIPSMDPALFE